MKATITELPITLHLHIAEVQLKDLDIIGELRFKSHIDILYSSCIMTEATESLTFTFIRGKGHHYDGKLKVT